MSFKATIEADIKGFTNNIDKAIGSVDKLEKTTLQKLSKVGDSFVSIGKKASILSAALVGVGAKAFSMAADFEDAMGATDQVFKTSSEEIQNWAKSLSSEYGVAKKEALEYANLMGTMLKNIGNLTEREASAQSKKLVELAGDLTAMYGGTTSEAINALTASLRGINVPIAKYGVGINDALVKAKAFEMGIASLTGELSIQARQAATLQIIWEQTADAQGQAGREADTASGAMRAFRTEVANLSTEIGETLLPIITPMIAKLTEATQGFRELSTETQSLIVGIAGVTAVAGPLLVVIGKILKALPMIKTALAALSGSVGLVVGGIVAGTVLIITHWDELKIASKNVVEYIKDDWNRLKESLEVTSSSISKLMKADFSGWWEDVKKSFDLSIDYIKNRWQQFKGIFEEPLSAQAGIVIGGIEQALKNISDEEPEATASLSNFSDAVKEIKELDTFQKLIGEQLNVRDAVTKTVSTIEDLQSKLVKLQLGILPSTNVRQELAETQQQINDLSTALDLLTGGRELNIKVNTNISGIEAEENKFLKDGAIVVPPIDTSLLENSLGQAKEMVAISSEQLGSLLSTGISMFAQTIGDAFAGNWDGLGAGLLKAVGSLAQQFGGLVVGMAIAAEKLKEIIVGNPLAAIAAGTALIALGAAASGAAQNMISSATGGSGYSSAPSLRNTGPGYAPSEYRGQYQDDFKVEFKIGTNELVGVLNTAEQRRNRL